MNATGPPPGIDHAALRAMVDIARAAGEAILRIYERAAAPAVRHKADASPLTEADLAADRVIVAGLQRRFPDTLIATEESIGRWADLGAAPGFFLVDPLDGTREFLARNGEFTVNIAWVVAGRPRAGVVHLPATGQTYAGSVGLGAWRDAHPPAATPAHALGEPIRVAPPRAGEALRVLASRSHGDARERALLEALPAPRDIVAAGSSLKFCRIAEGAAHLYPRLTPTMPWDTAAGQAVLESAGGVVLAAGGRPLQVPATPRPERNPAFFAACDPGLAQLAMRLCPP